MPVFVDHPLAFLPRLGGTMEQPVPDFHPETGQNHEKSPVSLTETGLRFTTYVLDQLAH